MQTDGATPQLFRTPILDWARIHSVLIQSRPLTLENFLKTKVRLCMLGLLTVQSTDQDKIRRSMSHI